MGRYAMVQNAGELPIWGMRLLGLSEKGQDKIGQFGTGLKESIAFLARMDSLPVIYSGECRIDFAIRSVDTKEEICFRLSESRSEFEAGKWNGLGIHPDYGVRDWDDPWMIFREIVCNAIDESGVDNMYRDIVEGEPEGVAGATRVYVPTTNQIEHAFHQVGERILHLQSREPIARHDGIGELYEKTNREPLQVFHRGVWVDEDRASMLNDAPWSLYDYELSSIRLNEARGADWFGIRSAIARMVALFTKDQAKNALWHSIVSREDSGIPYELGLMSMAGQVVNPSSNKWVEAFIDMFGKDAIVSDNDKFVVDKIKQAGKKPIIVMNDGLRTFLRKAGAPFPDSVLNESDLEYDSLRDPTAEESTTFDYVWNSCKRAGITFGKGKPGFRIFWARPDGNTVVMGEYKNGTVLLNEDYIGSRSSIVTMIEEIGHHVSGEADYTRGFQMWCCDAISRM